MEENGMDKMGCENTECRSIKNIRERTKNSIDNKEWEENRFELSL